MCAQEQSRQEELFPAGQGERSDLPCGECDEYLVRTPSGWLACPCGHGKLTCEEEPSEQSVTAKPPACPARGGRGVQCSRASACGKHALPSGKPRPSQARVCQSTRARHQGRPSIAQQSSPRLFLKKRVEGTQG